MISTSVLKFWLKPKSYHNVNASDTSDDKVGIMATPGFQEDILAGNANKYL